jgi:hypothetical protein
MHLSGSKNNLTNILRGGKIDEILPSADVMEG